MCCKLQCKHRNITNLHYSDINCLRHIYQAKQLVSLALTHYKNELLSIRNNVSIADMALCKLTNIILFEIDKLIVLGMVLT